MTCHSRTVRSALALARIVPSGENTTASTRSVWPLRGGPNGRGADRSATSHNRTVRSAPALARMRPSGENATEITQPVWPVSL